MNSFFNIDSTSSTQTQRLPSVFQRLPQKANAFGRPDSRSQHLDLALLSSRSHPQRHNSSTLSAKYICIYTYICIHLNVVLGHRPNLIRSTVGVLKVRRIVRSTVGVLKVRRIVTMVAFPDPQKFKVEGDFERGVQRTILSKESQRRNAQTQL